MKHQDPYPIETLESQMLESPLRVRGKQQRSSVLSHPTRVACREGEMSDGRLSGGRWDGL